MQKGGSVPFLIRGVVVLVSYLVATLISNYFFTIGLDRGFSFEAYSSHFLLNFLTFPLGLVLLLSSLLRNTPLERVLSDFGLLIGPLIYFGAMVATISFKKKHAFYWAYFAFLVLLATNLFACSFVMELKHCC